MVDIPPAAVERGAKAISTERLSSLITPLDYSRAVLTAALRLDDPETRSRVGQAIRSGVLAGPARGKGTYDDVADLAISALLAEPEEAEDG